MRIAPLMDTIAACAYLSLRYFTAAKSIVASKMIPVSVTKP